MAHAIIEGNVLVQEYIDGLFGHGREEGDRRKGVERKREIDRKRNLQV